MQCADILSFILAKKDTVHYGQTFPHLVLSKYTILRVVCSDINLSPFPFQRKKYFPGNSSKYPVLIQSSPDKNSNCVECFPLVSSLSHCRMMDFKLSGNGLIIDSHNWLFNIMGDAWTLQTIKLPIFLFLCSAFCAHAYSAHTCRWSINQVPSICSTLLLPTL